ncbi:PDZ domain-containing 4 isoform X1 [Pelobates cultripes]|uniref:PDZ domain-containing 4 isoform X1 n=1 Tax=Pelobates cultripes TaxID=61616 RepID=A0AAD1T5N0_PELCU|nr:PDZ domain-containing 4 isoform X1 [Pelobates cultripes]
MGCNMCVVRKPEEHYKVMLQVNGKELSRLSQEQTFETLRTTKDPLLIQVLRRSPRMKGTLATSSQDLQFVDSGTQTDITFEHIMTMGKARPPSPAMVVLEPYVLSELPPIGNEFYDQAAYMDGAQPEGERTDELEYEEVELCKSNHLDKLGLTVCYRTDDEEDLGIYVGEVNPNSIAARDGRIREGDRILQINGIDVQNREEAVAILTQEENTNVSLLVARPETEMGRRWKDSDREDFLDDLVSENEEELQAQRLNSPPQQQVENEAAEPSPKSPRPFPLPAGLSRSQELDSGVGRTDESTRNDESSEHDLLGDDQTSTANTPGSQRRLRFLRGDSQHPLQCREFHHSLDSLLAADGSTPYGEALPPAAGLTDVEYERYRELLEITCHLENGNGPAFLYASRQGGLDVNRNESVLREMAVLEEELRHLEFKFRNVLRAQKMQQLRERCMKAWLLEEEDSLYEFVGGGTANIEASTKLPDITELPERSDKDSTSAYNTGESCRSTPLMIEPPIPLDSPLRRINDTSGALCQAAEGLCSNANINRGHVKNVPPYPGSPEHVSSKFRSLCRDGRHTTDERLRRGAKPGNELDRGSRENSPYLSRRQRSQGGERYRSCLQLAQQRSLDELDGDPTCVKGIGVSHGTHPHAEPRMEWKVKVRSDGTRYVAKRPVRDRLLKARAMKIKEERSGMTTDDDAVSEMKMGRYWSKEDRKRHLMRAREQRKRREFMMQSRLDCLREQQQQQQGVEGKGEMSIIALSHRKTMKKRNKKILDNWITIQEMLAHGTRSADGKRVYNPLLSVTTV